jgi:hypothetical protein
VVVFATGLAGMWWVAPTTDKNMRTELLEQARIAARALAVDNISALSGSEQDLTASDYQRLKAQLAAMRGNRYRP